MNEVGRLLRNHQIAAQREIDAGAGGYAVHRAHDWQRQRAQGQHKRSIVFFDGETQVDRLTAGSDGAVAEILPGAEAAPGPGE